MIFRCFVGDGCTSIDGSPIIPLVWDQFGAVMMLGYVVCFLFLTFGLFNLIMATIVESTMEAGKLDDAKRARLRQREHVKLAHAVRDLVRVLFTEGNIDFDSVQAAQSGLTKWTGKIIGRMSSNHRGREMTGMLTTRISGRRFISLFDHPKIYTLLDKLGVQTIDPSSFL